MAKRIGELLVEAGVLSQSQLEQALFAQRKDGRKLGAHLVEMGFVSETQLTQTLSRQLGVPWVSLYHVEFSRLLLNLVPRELAEKYGLVPIFVRHEHNLGDTLYLAMQDPTLGAAIDDVALTASLPVRAMIACPSDLREAIRVYYAGKTVAAQPPALVPAPPPSASHVVQPPPSSRGHRPRMVSLTLLDGTKVRLPTPKPPGSQPDAAAARVNDQLTARDLLAALRAVSHGADASEVLGPNVRWEAMFGALLSVLLRKGIIADWEFIEEYRKT